MEREEWRAVVGYENMYEVSSIGRVRSLDRIVKFNSSIEQYKDQKQTRYGRMLRLGSNQRGYPMVQLWRACKMKRVYVHRLVAAAFIGDPGDLQVNHKDGVKQNNRVENLEYVTGSQNHIHARKNSLMKTKRGEECSYSKLCNANVFDARAMYANGAPTRLIAKKYNVTMGHMARVIRGEVWAHLKHHKPAEA